MAKSDWIMCVGSQRTSKRRRLINLSGFSLSEEADTLTFRFCIVAEAITRHSGLNEMWVVKDVLLLFLVPFAFFSNVLSGQIIPAHLGGTLGRSSHEPKYKIEFCPEDSLFHPDDDQEALFMRNKDGQDFMCYLPKVEKMNNGKTIIQQNTNGMIEETEERDKLKTPDDLLEVLKDRCFIRQEGWWSYEFCYQKKLRQLHLEDEKVVQEFVLGVFDVEATTVYNQNLADVSTLKDPRSKDAAQRYFPHQYTNGTVCDLTKRPRETEIRFICSEPRAMISSITEISTCKYALTVHCPTLCKHPLFQEERPVSHIIYCNTMPKRDISESRAGDEASINEIVMVKESQSSNLEE